MDETLYKLYETIFEPLEKGLVSIGVNTPLKTTILVSVLAAGAFWGLKPRTLFTADGSPRPWNLLLNSDGSVSQEATPVPWWLAAGTTGYIAGLVI